jgi:hypothetical protein
VAPSAIHIGREWKFPHSRVGTTIAVTISSPPIVGVPAFAWWAWGPSARIFCPSRSRRSPSIIGGPRTKHTSSAVIAAYAARKVM